MEMDTIFTKEAERLLEQEVEGLRNEFRQAAVDEALRLRGEPVEVTASDVKRARRLFTKRAAPLYPMTWFILRLYIVTGLLVFVGGIAYPYLRQMLDTADSVARVSVILTVSGLILVAVSLVMKFYFHALRGARYLKRRSEKQRNNSNR